MMAYAASAVQRVLHGFKDCGRRQWQMVVRHLVALSKTQMLQETTNLHSGACHHSGSVRSAQASSAPWPLPTQRRPPAGSASSCRQRRRPGGGTPPRPVHKKHTCCLSTIKLILHGTKAAFNIHRSRSRMTSLSLGFQLTVVCQEYAYCSAGLLLVGASLSARFNRRTYSTRHWKCHTTAKKALRDEAVSSRII